MSSRPLPGARLGRPLLLIALLACLSSGCQQRSEAQSPQAVMEVVQQACSRKDVGAVIAMVDRAYADDLGGPGRLEDDLRQLFAVYGALDLRLRDVVLRGDRLHAAAALDGRALRYRGPLVLDFAVGPMGPLIHSGLFSDLRAIIETLRQRRIAVERGSIERAELVISMEYGKERAKRAALIQRLEQSFAAVQDTALIVADLDIIVERDRAQVTQSYLLVTHVSKKAIERRDTERLVLRKEGTRWRITEGLG